MHDKINPWKDVAISGHVLDSHGQKMSKSKGNVIAPQEVIEKYGADAFRFWTASSKLGEDMPFQVKDIVTGQKTVTKLWNASKFIFMHLKDFDGKKPKKIEILDQFILSRLAKVVIESTDNFDNYEYSKTKFETENFFWNLFCDYYLEMIKDRVYNPTIRGEEQRRSAQYALKTCLITIIKLFAPIMPFITEELYIELFSKEEGKNSVHLSEWPKFKKTDFDKGAEKTGDRFLEIVKAVRQYKSANSKSLKSEINLVLDKKDKNIMKDAIEDLRATVNARTINYDEFSISFVE
jgi:valyl-tRNA synthetase